MHYKNPRVIPSSSLTTSCSSFLSSKLYTRGWPTVKVWDTNCMRKSTAILSVSNGSVVVLQQTLPYTRGRHQYTAIHQGAPPVHCHHTRGQHQYTAIHQGATPVHCHHTRGQHQYTVITPGGTTSTLSSHQGAPQVHCHHTRGRHQYTAAECM